jgi:hypothetical protein
MGIERYREIGRSTRVAYSLKAALSHGAGDPTHQPGDIELTVGATKPSSHGTRKKLQWERRNATLSLSTDGLPKYHHHAAAAK